LIDDLIDIVSKNGNLLLNIGPKSDGTIPEGQVNVLFEMGRWLDINGEGIYGTRPWTVAGEGPTENPDGGFGESKRSEYSSKDFRFTSKGDDIYLFCLDLPIDKKMTVKALSASALAGKTIKTISLVGSTEPVKWKQKTDVLEITVPKQFPCEHAVCFKVQF